MTGLRGRHQDLQALVAAPSLVSCPGPEAYTGDTAFNLGGRTYQLRVLQIQILIPVTVYLCINGTLLKSCEALAAPGTLRTAKHTSMLL